MGEFIATWVKKILQNWRVGIYWFAAESGKDLLFSKSNQYLTSKDGPMINFILWLSNRPALTTGIIVLLFVVFLLWKTWNETRKQTTLSGRPETSGVEKTSLDKNTGATIIVDDFEFNIDRDALSKRRNLNQILEEADCVWALWNTGQDAWRRHLLRNPKIKRLILPDPHSDALQLLASGRGRQHYELVTEITATTGEAKEGGIPVRWFFGLIGNTMTFVNPESGHGWVQIEVVFAPMDSQTCPSFRVNQDGPYRSLYDALLEVYNKVWDASKPAPPA